VIDASALLAICQDETGASDARKAARNGLISSVNLSEVFVKSLEQEKFDVSKAIVHALGLDVVPFTEEQAAASAQLSSKTVGKGISLADRACLSLGIEQGMPIVTSDRAWLELEVDAEIILFRPSLN